jgi:hypothetical protein
MVVLGHCDAVSHGREVLLEYVHRSYLQDMQDEDVKTMNEHTVR